MKRRKRDDPQKHGHDDLRAQAEERLRETKVGADGAIGPEDPARLLHELQVHQIELELQNEELHEARDTAEGAAEKYADLYDYAPVGYFTIDNTGMILEANLAAANLLGVGRVGLLHRRLGAFLSQETLPAFNNFLHVITTVEAKSMCEVALGNEASRNWEQGTGNRYLRLEGIASDSDRSKSRCRVAMTDITERKRADDALKKARDELATIFDAAPSLIFYKDKNNRFIYVNKAMEKAMGRPKDQLEGRPLAEIYPDMAEAYWRDDLEVIVSGQSKLNIVETFQTPAGNHWVRTDKIPYRNEQGEIIGIIGFAEDITDRKLAEEALHRYELLARHSRDIILFVRREDGRFIEANDAAVNAYGYGGEELLTLAIKDLRLPEDAGLVEQQMAEADSKGTLFETVHRRKDGSTFPVEVSSRGITIGDHRVILSIIRDITERRQAQEALQRLADDLARSNLDLAQFASVASHDLQEPLRQITGFIKLIERRYSDELDGEAREYIGFVVGGAERMQQLIQDLLAWSRVGGTAAELHPVDAQKALDKVLSNLRASIRECGAMITHDPMPTVNANTSQLAQVFQNLIGNAIKFRKDKPPEIHIGVRREDHCWSFSVRDNGIGFAPEYAKDIFQIFKRLHLREEYAGTGIGLAICQKVIEWHGGEIRAESEPGNGTTFYFTLPDRG